jgi:hypothetical protein
MPVETQALWTKLGWDPSNWKSGGASTEGVLWVKLLEEQQAAALQLGFEQTSWDNLLATASTWGQWDNLPIETQPHWEKLGWTPSNWEIGGAPTEGLLWWELDEEQQSAAAQLDFSAKSWESEFGPGVQGVPLAEDAGDAANTATKARNPSPVKPTRSVLTILTILTILLLRDAALRGGGHR